MGVYCKRYVTFALVTLLGAETVLEAYHIGWAIPPHVEVNFPPPPPNFPRAIAPTGSGPLSINVHDAITPTEHVSTVFIIKP